MRLFLSGDVMTARGIDQILPHPGDPRLWEEVVDSALTYVALAERKHGPIPRRADFAYIWGDALRVLDRHAPDARVVVLETSVTQSGSPEPYKGIHYRMHPKNVGCLTAARIDCCVLSNNHVLDFGHAGLRETLDVLAKAGIRTVGAGRDASEAWRPVRLGAEGKQRVTVIAAGSATSGVPPSWAAGERSPGVALLENGGVERIEALVRSAKRHGDVVVVSLHWGGNWGYHIPEEQVRVAHALVRAGADVIHGHSSHHPRPIDVFEGKLVLYGCGDLLNDYEGIEGYEEFRGDLVAMYFADLAKSGELTRLVIVPMRIRRFRLERASREDAAWLRDVLHRESRRFGVEIELGEGPHPELLVRGGAA